MSVTDLIQVPLVVVTSHLPILPLCTLIYMSREWKREKANQAACFTAKPGTDVVVPVVRMLMMLGNAQAWLLQALDAGKDQAGPGWVGAVARRRDIGEGLLEIVLHRLELH